LTQNHPDFKLLESTDFRLAGNMAHKIVFTATDSMKHERKAIQIWTVNGDKAYLITYKAEPGQYSKGCTKGAAAPFTKSPCSAHPVSTGFRVDGIGGGKDVSFRNLSVREITPPR
jgi:hypothetical protein